MTQDRFEHHPSRMSDEPSYEAGYNAGLAGVPTPRHFDVLLEQVLWVDGWHACQWPKRPGVPSPLHHGWHDRG